jgi:uncharacterized repeat protein (TIGR01451 family)
MSPAVILRVDFVLRATLAVILLLMSIGPSPVQATGENQAQGDGSLNGQRKLPELPAEYYTPPVYERPTRTSPEEDKLKKVMPPQPAKKQVEFSLTPSSYSLQPGDQVELSVLVRNGSNQTLTGLQFTDPLEVGLEFVSTRSAGPIYDSLTRTIQYDLGNLGPGAATAFHFTLSVSAIPTGPQGLVLIHEATLKGDHGLQIKADTTLAVETDLPSDSIVDSVDANGSWHALGRASVYLQKDAIDGDAMVSSAPLENPGRGPGLQFKLDVYETGTMTRGANGQATEQKAAVHGKSGQTFAEPALLQINLNGYVDLEDIPAGQELFVASYDQKNDIWVKVPLYDLDPVANTVTVQTNHFSTWGVGLGESLPQNGANVLLFDQPYTSLFTGAASYSIPIWAPAGRAGLTPSVSLSYSSSTVDGVLGDVQAPWVGVGWNMDSIEIVRKITTDANGYGYINDFALTLNGAVYELVPDELHAGRYYAKRDAFLYIERHNKALGTGQSAPNDTGEWWEVVSTDGTRYRLGWNEDSEQLALMYGYSCNRGGNSCNTPDGAYGPLGYAGKAKDLVALRWRVDRIMDRHGNYMTYTYQEYQHDSDSTLAALKFDRESYLQYIDYNGFVGRSGASAIEPGYRVNFVEGDRSTVGDVTVGFTTWDNVDSKLLDKVEIQYKKNDGTWQTVRTYDLGYSLATAPNANGTLKLASVKISSDVYTDESSGVSIPSTTAATMKFTYSNMANREVSGSESPFNYPRLIEIDNGYGGLLNFTYETDGRGSSTWYNYRVKQVSVESGLGKAVLHAYSYATPVYSGDDSLVGYTTVTEQSLAYDHNNTPLAQTRHSFGTTGLDVGRELTTEWLSGNGQVLKKSVNAYVTDNSRAPFYGWNYRYLAQVKNYILSGSSLLATTTTTYYNDPNTGNRLAQEDYQGTSLYRRTYSEYLSDTSPEIYILGKIAHHVIVNASEQIFAETRYAYAGDEDYPSHDTAILQQVRSEPGSTTVDSETVFDVYGNAVGARAYANYGTLGTPPTENANDRVSSTTYDSTWQTFPVTSTDPMGNTSSSAYVQSLGLPYRSTDANGWSTTTTYDGLGRRLSATAPGLSSPGVIFTYPAPVNGAVTAPYAVQMQILDTLAGTYRSVWGIYDGLGRSLQTQVYDADQGSVLITAVSYGEAGQVERQSSPYYRAIAGGEYSAPNWTSLTYTQTDYDALGRTVQVTAPGNIVSSIAYEGLATISTDPDGRSTRQIADKLGRLSQVQEYSQEGGNQVLYATTSYSYDVADRMTRVVDAEGNTTDLSYDWLGRKIGMDDPDMGVWSYTYDPLGTLSHQTDARGQILGFTYDALSRMTVKRDLGTEIDPKNAILGSYQYGTTSGTIGLRTSMTDASIGYASGWTTTWAYTDFARQVTETRTVANDESFSFTTRTDWLGRTISTTYPDHSMVTYSYDALGRAKGLKEQGAQTDLAQLAYNVMGQVSTMTLGNGVIVSNDYYGDSQGDPNSSYRLEERSAKNSADATLTDFQYQYDQAGNITKITDGLLSETHSYEYDSLSRLISAEAENASGNYVYRQQFNYDPLGNIDSFSNWGYLPTPAPTEQGFDSPAEGAGSVLASYRLSGEQYQEIPTDTPTGTSTPTATDTPTDTLVPTNTPQPTSTDGPNPTGVFGNGLTGKYYTTQYALSAFPITANPFTTRTDVTVNFNWGTDEPVNNLGTDTFTIVWSGSIAPLYSEEYTFYVLADDGLYLKVDGQVLINSWFDGNTERTSTPITLQAGQRYNIELRYYENTGSAQAKLYWQSDHESKKIVPQANLYPFDTSITPPTPTNTATPTKTPAWTATNTPTRTPTSTATGLPTVSLMGHWNFTSYNGTSGLSHLNLRIEML